MMIKVVISAVLWGNMVQSAVGWSRRESVHTPSFSAHVSYSARLYSAGRQRLYPQNVRGAERLHSVFHLSWKSTTNFLHWWSTRELLCYRCHCGWRSFWNKSFQELHTMCFILSQETLEYRINLVIVNTQSWLVRSFWFIFHIQFDLGGSVA